MLLIIKVFALGAKTAGALESGQVVLGMGCLAEFERDVLVLLYCC